MIRLTLNLPTKRRLDLTFTPLFPDMGKVRSIKKGSKVSRFFKHFFEHKRAKKIFGANLAAFLIASSFMPTTNVFPNEPSDVITTTSPIVLKTQINARYPVDELKITQGYKFFHPGLDLDGVTGDAVYPIMEGKVDRVSYSRFAYGYAVYIDHGDGLSSLYAHLSKIFVKKDQEVDVRDEIGEIGSTGRVTGDHLHLEIRQNGLPINPATVLPAQ